jgi:hypothetical protein
LPSFLLCCASALAILLPNPKELLQSSYQEYFLASWKEEVVGEHFCFHPVGQNLIISPHLTAKESRKYSLSSTWASLQLKTKGFIYKKEVQKGYWERTCLYCSQ